MSRHNLLISTQQNFVILAYFSRGDKGKLCWKVFSSRPAWSSENGVVGKADSCASSCFIAGEVFAGRGCTNSFHAGWPQPACLVWEMCSALLLADSWAPEVVQCVQCAVFKTGLEDKKVEEVGGARRSSESMRAMFSLSLTKKYFAIQISTPILHKYLIDAKKWTWFLIF